MAFWRSPVAHARIKALRRPAGLEGSIFFREDMPEVKAIVAPSTLPSFKLSEQHHLAHGKVRFVGEPIACCVGRTRAEAEADQPILVDPRVRLFLECKREASDLMIDEAGAHAKGRLVVEHVARRFECFTRLAREPAAA